MNVSKGGSGSAAQASQKAMVRLSVEERSISAGLGFWVGPQLRCCAEGLQTHFSGNGSGVSEDTQDEKGAIPWCTQSQCTISEVTRTVLGNSLYGDLGGNLRKLCLYWRLGILVI